MREKDDAPTFFDTETYPSVIVGFPANFLNPQSSSLATPGFLKLCFDYAVCRLFEFRQVAFVDPGSYGYAKPAVVCFDPGGYGLEKVEQVIDFQDGDQWIQ